MPVIYILFGPNGKCYIGKTKYDFDYRWKLHWRDFKKYRRYLKLNIPYKGCSALYAAFNKYGMGNFEYDILYEGDFTPDELRALESQAIETHKTYAPFGYNLSTGGEGGHTSPETRQKMSIAQKARAETHSLEHRKHKAELEGLPMYTLYYEKEGIRGYRISGHPKCRNKRFASRDKPLSEHKQEVIDFLAGLTDEYETDRSKKQASIPQGISYNKHGKPGYVMSFTKQGTKYYRKFNQSDDATNLKDAADFLDQFLIHLNSDHECSSETKCQSAMCKEVSISKRTA